MTSQDPYLWLIFNLAVVANTGTRMPERETVHDVDWITTQVSSGLIIGALTLNSSLGHVAR